MPTPDHPASRWTVVLPVKVLSDAKTRIDPDRRGAGGRLARAFFRDTVTAIRACPRVVGILVATSDPTIVADAHALGLSTIDDTGQAGINAAARWAAGSAPADGPVAIIVSDLPCLTPDALESALIAAESSVTAFLADAEGTGTTMWMAAAGITVDPHFGSDSANAHRTAGCLDIAAADATGRAAAARRDVDTDGDLADARRLGVGTHTRDELRDPAGAPGSGAILTVVRRDEQRVALVDEQGARHEVPWSSLAAAGFREVRPGQRVVVDPLGTVGLP